MQENTIEQLEWDSQFFEYPVARVSFTQDADDNLDDLFSQLKSRGFKVTYFFVSPQGKGIIDCIVKNGGVLVDQKTEFIKKTEIHADFSHSIIEFQGDENDETLIKLALQAGKYSRFRMDPNFKNNEYVKLYIEWLRKSIKNKVDFKVLISKSGNVITGFSTLNLKGNIIEINLVAVDEFYRGLGIGYDLINSADSFAYIMGFEEIKVVTQLKNKPACRLYEKCFFHLDNIINIYHYWQ